MIQYQILQTNIIRTVWQTERRITNEILGGKGLKGGKENVFKGHEQQHLKDRDAMGRNVKHCIENSVYAVKKNRRDNNCA